MRIITEREVFEHLTPRCAVETLRQALEEGYDPAEDFSRKSYDLAHGQLLTMPSTTRNATGIKVLTVNEEHDKAGVPLIQGSYLLFEGGSLTPTAVIDGAALTSLRTPAVSFAGVLEYIQDRADSLRVAIMGTGPQGIWHEKTVRDVAPAGATVQVTYISRKQPEGMDNWVQVQTDAAYKVLSEADLILCCTSARQPILTRAMIKDDAVVVAVGSHTLDARELSSDLMAEAQVIVEDKETAQAEAGDLMLAVEEKALELNQTVTMRDVVIGRVKLNRESPIVFKTTGMGWEDLVLAQKIAELV